MSAWARSALLASGEGLGRQDTQSLLLQRAYELVGPVFGYFGGDVVSRHRCIQHDHDYFVLPLVLLSDRLKRILEEARSWLEEYVDERGVLDIQLVG